MDVVETFIARNGEFAAAQFSTDLKIIPSLKTIVLGCVDSRVDPADIFVLNPGEAVIIRNVGGRVDAAMIETLVLLRAVAQAAGKDIGAGWNLIVLQHTDCGILSCYRHAPDLLAKYLRVPRDTLETLAVTDPYAAVKIDVAALKANPELPGGFIVSGLVYDVATGHTQVIVPPALLRDDAAA